MQAPRGRTVLVTGAAGDIGAVRAPRTTERPAARFGASDLLRRINEQRS